jgi:hypothetical protein
MSPYALYVAPDWVQTGGDDEPTPMLIPRAYHPRHRVCPNMTYFATGKVLNGWNMVIR